MPDSQRLNRSGTKPRKSPVEHLTQQKENTMKTSTAETAVLKPVIVR
jgi:hypothetical protein